MTESMANVRFCIQTKRKGMIIHNGHSKATTMAKWECLLKLVTGFRIFILQWILLLPYIVIYPEGIQMNNSFTFLKPKIPSIWTVYIIYIVTTVSYLSTYVRHCSSYWG